MSTHTETETYPFFFTWQAQRGARPLHLVSGQGATFETADGATWIDLGSLTYQANLGHGHPRMIAAVKRQADALCLAAPSAVYPAKVALAEALLALAPEGFTKVFFTLGGAEAIENALKIARMVTGRYKLISRYRSYHGATMGALTLSGDYRRPPLEPGLPGVIHALDCRCSDCARGDRLGMPGDGNSDPVCATNITELLEREGPGSVAAVFLESIPGANGVWLPGASFWPRVRAACDRHGTLLVADEVLTGFGRTGRWFGFEHHGVVPDMITVGKALTGGYGTLGAVLVHGRVARHFDDRVLLAGLTHYAHPLGCAAALEAINIYRDEGLIARAATLDGVQREHAEGLMAAHPRRIQAVRSLGLLTALEFAPMPSDAWGRLVDAIERRHVYLHTRSQDRTLILSPPLCIDPPLLSEGFERLGMAISEALPDP